MRAPPSPRPFTLQFVGPNRSAAGAVTVALALTAWLCVIGLGCGEGTPADRAAPSSLAAAGAVVPSAGAQRIVSLNPSLTAILVALGAQDRLIGVDDFSAQSQPAVSSLPRVGGLFSPSLEAVVALEPDLVVLVPGVEQRAFRERIAALGIETRAFENVSFDAVLSNITGLGALAGRQVEAAARVAAIEQARASVEAAVTGRSIPRALLVLQRDPLYVVGSGSFIDEMVRVAGAHNIAAEFSEAYPQISVEWVVAAAPEVIIDMSADAGGAAGFWARWPTLPAVAQDRIATVDPDLVTLPGPLLDRSLIELARVLHGPAVVAAAPFATDSFGVAR